MNAPLDHHAADRNGLIRAARLFSNIISPPVMFAILGLAISWHQLPFWPGLAWAAVYGFFVSLAPILFVLYILGYGHKTQLHKSERHLPYLSAVLFSAIAYGIVTLGDGPELLRCLTIFNMIELAALALINIFWLISIHATGIMATLVIVGMIFGWAAGIGIVLPFVIAVCAVRLYLKRHTPAQIVAGLVLGILSVYSLTITSCF
jgi:membrane-associated phospholipid phosphatase